MSYRSLTYYWHCLAVAKTMPPGQSRDWWYIHAGNVYQRPAEPNPLNPAEPRGSVHRGDIRA